MLRKTLLPLLLAATVLFAELPVQASGLRMSGLTWYDEGAGADRKASFIFTVEWDHGWRNEKNHDAAWIFLKFSRPEAAPRHAYISKNGVKIISDHTGRQNRFTMQISDDQSGFYIYPAEKFRGKVHLTLRATLDMIKTGNLGNTTGLRPHAYGIEMVHIPAGGFYIGEPDSASARRFQAFYLSAPDGKHRSVFEIKSEEDDILIGKGSLYYEATEPHYQGDMKGVLPKSFPKGVRAFYCMKYELTQGQYADFLNSLSPQQNTARSNTGGSHYYRMRGSIRNVGHQYMAGFPDRPCNFLSWDDAMAYADWACLRPMTELEFTKAARGTEKPAANAFPWGTSSKEKLQRLVNEEGDLVFTNNLAESELNDMNRDLYGASFYWVMDLAGSLWERVITIGDEKGRSFTGQHGDGRLSGYGSANVPGWPAGTEETGGFGFRGGGFYTHDRSYHEFNPYSPVSYRRFAAWSGGARVESYGSRFVRTD